MDVKESTPFSSMHKVAIQKSTLLGMGVTTKRANNFSGRLRAINARAINPAMRVNTTPIKANLKLIVRESRILQLITCCLNYFAFELPHLAFAFPNLVSQQFIEGTILEDKTVYPDDATMQRLYTISAHDPKTERLMNRLWIRIKTGR